MTIKNEKDITRVICEDKWMMELLHIVKTLNLPDWWICAGFVRSKIWDVLHGFETRTPLSDIDVIYYDPDDTDERVEKRIEGRLRELLPNVPWSVKNQARMHAINHLPPFTSSVDGIAKFPETVTALGVKLNEQNNIVLTAPWGIDDVILLDVKPTPIYLETKDLFKVYENRMKKKAWEEVWSMVRVHYPN
ncbi:nucleotidyltransferase family protein [Bacillus sp. S/N-304-OC-R1]|uniref:nucleotidyltransferase family protein n=1 Tax=Bacillus sp. S/N-304-OC-R1 TaxID=2758034 RepID=UPI001C8D0C82|nr:nucleotidyltransferase family protein [Bacillus sp. S/N-304-OC-R1]MBY0122003.1 nucleotidyltransferase family protein [Bacillus sp. S/N-304-OC-R1]